jgi:4-amino-4-deoxy-L-arabinose transferase-like glycosyltransferase
MRIQNNGLQHLILSLICLLLFVPFLGNVSLFDWDEINFAEAAREMIVSGNWAQVKVNFSPFWEKPPLFFWLQALSMKVFGINEFAARFPNALCGLITINLIFHIGKENFGLRFALLWVLFYLGSFTPFFYFKSGIIDPWFNLFIFSSLYLIFLAARSKYRNLKYWFFSGVLLGLAVITKGPVSLLIVGLVCLVYLIINGFRLYFNAIMLLIFILGIFIFPALWFIPETLKNGPWFVKTFLSYQVDLFFNPVASHGQPWFYHPIVLLIGCFPASIFAINKLGTSRGYTAGQNDLKRWLTILFWVVLVLFSIVTTKIVHYSSLCYFPITFLAALTIYDWVKNYSKPSLNIAQKSFLVFVSILWLIILLIVPYLGNNYEWRIWLADNVADVFAKENILAKVDWNWKHYIPLIFFTLAWVLFYINYFYFKQQIKAVRQLLIYHCLGIFLLMALIVPMVEKHSQHAVIDYYKSLKDEENLVLTYKFKSYAPYFYAQVKPVVWTKEETEKRDSILSNVLKVNSFQDLSLRNIELFEEQWKAYLLSHPSKRTIRVVSLIHKSKEMEENSLFIKTGEKAGFVFFKNR